VKQQFDRFRYLLTSAVNIAGCEGARPKSLDYEGDEIEVGLEDAKYIENNRLGIPRKGQRSPFVELPNLLPNARESYLAMLKERWNPPKPQKEKTHFKIRMLTADRVVEGYPGVKAGQEITVPKAIALRLKGLGAAEFVDEDPSIVTIGVVGETPPLIPPLDYVIEVPHRKR